MNTARREMPMGKGNTMELSDTLKCLRKELGMTQAELGAELHVSNITVNRWETGRTVPRPKMRNMLLRLAKKRGASEQCRERLRKNLREKQEEALNVPSSALFPLDRATLCRLVDDACIGVIVCDAETDEMLYANHKAVAEAGGPFKPEQTCYAYLCGLDAPCEDCPTEVTTPCKECQVQLSSGQSSRVRSISVDWNKRPAYVRYIL